ncbi:hypothetical protein dsx2_1797 [Desulfovibrio sp. X2]|uniref:hypothetical protein n=1 Tax=Desulfovibrio sp. X2 TaxID=941449 RepID=UPI000358EE66|nr:hypothetical protein [Desulfovibrio sp. X2]EPR44202.1 hypothetical protein dsx2_1797 [Desulfovibrio sp. X2]
MPVTTFARIKTARVMMAEGQARLVVAMELLHDVFSRQISQLEMPISVMPRLLDYAGVTDFGDLPGKIVRLETDLEGEPLNLAGPSDGQWLFRTIHPAQSPAVVAA